MEIRGHRGSTEREEELGREHVCVRRVQETQAREVRRKEIGRSKERGTLIVCEYTNARQTRRFDSRRYRPQNVQRLGGEGRRRKNAGWKLVIRNALNSVVHYLRLACARISSEYHTVKLPFPPLLDLLDFTTDQGDRTKTKRDGCKKKGKGKRRQEAKRSAQ